MKIIHLLCHTIPYIEDYVFDGWPARTAKNILRYTSLYDHECWFAVNNIDKRHSEVRNGIKYKLFPAWTLSKKLESFFGIVISKSLLRDLKEEVKKGNVILHVQGERGLLVWQAVKTCRNIPIVIQFHGYITPDILLLLERFLIAPFEKYYFKFVDYFFVSIRHRIDYLINTLNIPSERIYNQNLGVDYTLFKPADKAKAKKELNIPRDKKVILYVGLFNETKGGKKIIDAHIQIKDKFNTFLILIGGNKTDQFYEYAMKNADLVLERIAHDLLPKYFNVADVYCMVCSNEKVRYGGLGIASMEAVACNVPILNSNLSDAPIEISDKIGFRVHSVESLVDKMIYIFRNRDKFRNLHQLSKPFFSWESVIQNTLKLYERLAAKNS